MNLAEKKTVICALSGGVDSAVTALLLKQKYNVQGIFLKMHNNLDEAKAQKMADKLEIPLIIIDVRKEFRERVIKLFLQEYQNNKTPNPCIICNKDLKFYFLLKYLQKLNAEFVATGHYARIIRENNNYHLLRARYLKKDQSYFLYRLTHKDLEKIIFPLGEYDKNAILKIARQNNLINDEYQESQEICFISDNINDYLKQHLGEKRGKIIDINGQILGDHQGLHFYTIGQRRGIGFSGGPFYVVKKDKKNNILIVSKNKKDLAQKIFEIIDSNWINKISFPIKAKVKIRNKSKLYDTILSREKSRYVAELKEAEIGITLGQSAVFYQGDEVLGGGIIA